MERDDDHKKWGARRAPRLDQDTYEWEPPPSPRDSVSHGEPESEQAKSLLTVWRSALDAMRDAVVRQHQMKQEELDEVEEAGVSWGDLPTDVDGPN